MLDTDVASLIIRDPSSPVRAQLARALAVCVSAITEGEMLFGLAKKPHALRLAAGVREFLRHVEILPWTSAAAQAYGGLRARLEGSGTPLGALDTLIAAHAMAEEAVLVTSDRAFSRVPGLSVEDWLAA